MTPTNSDHPKDGAAGQLPAGFVVTAGRQAKAQKILQILAEAGSGNADLGRRPRLLDIGTGNGEIARHLASVYDVVSVDLRDQRQVAEGFTFVRVEDESLPFPSESFDVVVSNHVIEHVRNWSSHLEEVARVLKIGGLAYLATPNRWWPWEVHYRLPLLHYLPAGWFMAVLKRLGRYQEDVRLLSLADLRRYSCRWFSVELFSDRILKWPHRYHMQCPSGLAGLLARIPLSAYRLAGWIHPTLVVVLKRR